MHAVLPHDQAQAARHESSWCCCYVRALPMTVPYARSCACACTTYVQWWVWPCGRLRWITGAPDPRSKYPIQLPTLVLKKKIQLPTLDCMHIQLQVRRRPPACMSHTCRRPISHAPATRCATPIATCIYVCTNIGRSIDLVSYRSPPRTLVNGTLARGLGC